MVHKAIQLLKIGGKIVYSTCTYNTGENEEIIDWALSTFPSIRVVDADLKLGKPGYRIGQLTKEDCNAMQVCKYLHYVIIIINIFYYVVICRDSVVLVQLEMKILIL